MASWNRAWNSNSFSNFTTENDVGMDFKIILEPGGAVALASALFNKIAIKNKTVVIIASGGNVDPDIFEKSLKISI